MECYKMLWNQMKLGEATIAELQRNRILLVQESKEQLHDLKRQIHNLNKELDITRFSVLYRI